MDGLSKIVYVNETGDGRRAKMVPSDMLKESFDRQEKFMELLRENDLMPEWPVDLTTKQGQRMIREVIQNLCEEIFEASFTLKNKTHRLTDDRAFDSAHYKEELGDAFAYLMEVCILSGISSEELYDEYCRKNAIVRQRLADGY